MSLADKAGLKQDDLLDVLGLGAMANPMFGEQQERGADAAIEFYAAVTAALRCGAGVSWCCCGGGCCCCLRRSASQE
jgi:hypothetical protein